MNRIKVISAFAGAVASLSTLYILNRESEAAKNVKTVLSHKKDILIPRAYRTKLPKGDEDPDLLILLQLDSVLNSNPMVVLKAMNDIKSQLGMGGTNKGFMTEVIGITDKAEHNIKQMLPMLGEGGVLEGTVDSLVSGKMVRAVGVLGTLGKMGNIGKIGKAKEAGAPKTLSVLRTLNRDNARNVLVVHERGDWLDEMDWESDGDKGTGPSCISHISLPPPRSPFSSSKGKRIRHGEYNSETINGIVRQKVEWIKRHNNTNNTQTHTNALPYQYDYSDADTEEGYQDIDLLIERYISPTVASLLPYDNDVSRWEMARYLSRMNQFRSVGKGSKNHSHSAPSSWLTHGQMLADGYTALYGGKVSGGL